MDELLNLKRRLENLVRYLPKAGNEKVLETYTHVISMIRDELQKYPTDVIQFR